MHNVYAPLFNMILVYITILIILTAWSFTANLHDIKIYRNLREPFALPLLYKAMFSISLKIYLLYSTWFFWTDISKNIIACGIVIDLFITIGAMKLFINNNKEDGYEIIPGKVTANILFLLYLLYFINI